MPETTFYSLIARNKRNSLLLMAIFILLFAGLGLLFGYVWGGWGETTHSTVRHPAPVHRYTPTPGPESVPPELPPPYPIGQPGDSLLDEAQYAQADRQHWIFAITVAAGAGLVAFFLTLLSYYGGASAVLAASIFHFGTYTVRQAKEHLRAAGLPVRL